MKGKQPERAALVAALADAKPKLDAKLDDLFRDRLSALVMYIGSTGLLPDELEAVALSADQAASKFPDLGIGKGAGECQVDLGRLGLYGRRRQQGQRSCASNP